MSSCSRQIALRVLSLLVFVSQRNTFGYTSTYFLLEGDCPGPSILFVRNSVQVSLTSNHLRYIENARRKCSLTFQTQRKDHRLLLHWDVLRLVSDTKQHHGVFLKGGRYIPTPGEDRVDFNRNDYRSHFNQITLYYFGFPHFEYLRVTVTEIRLARSCSGQQFLCPRVGDTFCISHELICNGEYNCGDANVSDENHTSCMRPNIPPVIPTDSPVPIGLVAVLTVQPVIISLLIGAFCFLKKQRRDAEMASNLQHRSNEPASARAQNEYVTLPHNTAITPQKEYPGHGLPNMHTTQSPTRFSHHDSQSHRDIQSRPFANIVSPPSVVPRRMLPPTPEEEPESNYVNVHLEGGSVNLPLLFQVPDINAMPLLHTTGLHKSAIEPKIKRTLPKDQLVSISEPGYVEIYDKDVTRPTSPSSTHATLQHSQDGAHHKLLHVYPRVNGVDALQSFKHPAPKPPVPSTMGSSDHMVLDMRPASRARRKRAIGHRRSNLSLMGVSTAEDAEVHRLAGSQLPTAST